MAIEKQILVSEKDFQELEDKAKQWDEYKRDYSHFIEIEVYAYREYEGHRQLYAYSGSPSLPKQFQSIIDEALKEMQKALNNRINTQQEKPKNKLNKIPKWIRRIFGAD